jgi:hypothetical protein
VQILQTLIIILPFIALAIRNESRMTRLETNIKWIMQEMKKDGGCEAEKKETENVADTTDRTIAQAD